MGELVRGDVVVIPFPFSDLSATKRRPALVVAKLDGNDLVRCQITSRALCDRYAMAIDGSDFVAGGLRQDSNVRTNRLFTADSTIVAYRAGTLRPEVMAEVTARIVGILQA